MYLCTDTLHSLLQLDLYEAGWLNSGLFPGIHHRQVAMNALNSSLLKKFHNDQTDDVRDDKALQLFLSCNSTCQSFGSLFPRRLDEALIIGEMKSIIYDFFNPRSELCFKEDKYASSREPILLNLGDIATHFGLGSGSNIGTTSTDFYTKFVNSTMSHTNPALPLLFRQAISSDKLWTGVEAFRFARFGSEIVRGSRLSFVPKSQLISRTICTEPLLNMLFQKGIAGVLERRLFEVFHIDLSNQPSRNAAMARMGSLDNRFGTIDLSSASDSISSSLIRDLVPYESRKWLEMCRSPSTTLPGGEEVELHMISSMGNGFTFPLQTMIFASLVTAAYRVYDIKIVYPRGRALGNFAVFGDDIIVDQRVYDAVVRCLEVCGFSVNRDKSFNEGLFRESCGSDYYFGRNIRGVYIKTLNSPGDFYSAINRLNRWSSNHGVILSRTIGYLRRHCRFIGVPYDEADDAGIKIPFSLLRNVRRDRNGAFKYNALVNVPRRVFLSNVESERIRQKSACGFNDPLDWSLKPSDFQRIRGVLPKFVEYPDGYLFALLAGWLRDGHLGLRTLKPKAVLRRRVCPGWDESIAARGESPEFAATWKGYVEANLVS